MLLARKSETSWHLEDENDFFPSFRVARDYLNIHEYNGMSSADLLGRYSPPSSVAAKASHHYDAFPQSKTPRPAYYPEGHFSKSDYSAVGGHYYGWQSRGSDIVGPPAVAASSAWESFGSDSCSSLGSSPLLQSSGGGSKLKWLTATVPATDRPELPSIALNESRGAVEDTAREAEGRTSFSPQNCGFCFSKVSDSIDKLINDSLKRLCNQAPVYAENTSPIHDLEDEAYAGNFQHGPSTANSEGWAAAAAAAAFAAASISHTEDLLVGSPESRRQTELGTGIKLDPAEIDAFLRAKSKTEEVAARIKAKVAATRNARMTSDNLPRPCTPSGKLATGVRVPPPSLRFNQRSLCRHPHIPLKEQTASHHIPEGSAPRNSAISSSPTQTKQAKILPNRRSGHTPSQRKAKKTPVRPTTTETFLALGTRLQGEGPKAQYAPAKAVGTNSEKTVLHLFPRVLAFASGARTPLGSRTVHLPEEKSVAPVAASASQETHAVNGEPASRGSLPVSGVASYETPLMRARSQIGESRSPVKAQDSLLVPPPQTTIPEGAEHRMAYPAFAPVHPTSSAPRGKEVAAADEKLSGVSTTALSTASTTTRESASAVEEIQPHVPTKPSQKQRIDKVTTQKAVPDLSSCPASNGCTVASGKQPLTTTASKPSVPNQQPAALRHLARVMCKALSSAASRELRNSTLAFFRRCYNRTYCVLPPAKSSVAPGSATVAEAAIQATSKTSETLQFAHGSTPHDCQENDSDLGFLHACSQANESRGLFGTKIQQPHLRACYGTKCTKEAHESLMGSSCEGDPIPSPVNSKEVRAVPAATILDVGMLSSFAVNTSSCHRENKEDHEIPGASEEPERDNVAPGTVATAASNPAPNNLKASTFIDRGNVSFKLALATKALAASDAVPVDAAAVHAVQPQLGKLVQPILQISGNKQQFSSPMHTNNVKQLSSLLSPFGSREDGMETPKVVENRMICCCCATYTSVRDEMHQYRMCADERPKQQDKQQDKKQQNNPIDEPQRTRHSQGVEPRKQGNLTTNDLWKVPAHEYETSSPPTTSQCAAVLKFGPRGSNIERHPSYNEVMTALNRQLAVQLIALLPATFCESKVQGDSQRALASAEAVSLHRFPAVSNLSKQHMSLKLSSGYPSGGCRMTQPGLLGFGISRKEGLPVGPIATKPIGEEATTLKQKDKLIEKAGSESSSCAAVSVQTIMPIELAKQLQRSGTLQKNLSRWAEAASLVGDNQCELELFRQQQTQALSGQFKHPNFSRTKGEVYSTSCLQPPSEEQPVDLKHSQQVKQQQLQYAEAESEVSTVVNCSLEGGTKQRTEYKIDEQNQGELAYRNAATLGTRSVPLTRNLPKSEQKLAACRSSLEAKLHGPPHEELQRQDGQASSAIRQVLWGLLDRMEYVKLHLGPAQHLQTVKAPSTVGHHCQQHVQELSNLSKPPRSFHSHNKHNISTLNPTRCKNRRDRVNGQEFAHLCIVGKSMGSAAKQSAANCCLSNLANHRQPFLAFPALRRVSNGPHQWNSQHTVAPQDEMQQQDSGTALHVKQKSLPLAPIKKKRFRGRTGEPHMLAQNKRTAEFRGEKHKAVEEYLKLQTTAGDRMPEYTGGKCTGEDTHFGILGRRLCNATHKFQQHPNVGTSQTMHSARGGCSPLSTAITKAESTVSNSALTPSATTAVVRSLLKPKSDTARGSV